MAVTLYLLNSRQKVRAVITKGISELIHDETAWTLTAEIPAVYRADAGEYLGFECVDGRFRLFEIDDAADDEIRNVTEIVATDAAVAELTASICKKAEMEEAQAPVLAEAILQGSGWELGMAENGQRPAALAVVYETRWEALQQLETACGVRAEPYYVLENNAVQRRVVDVAPLKSTYRGRFVQQGLDADNVQIKRTKSPRPKVYALGATVPDENGENKRITIANTVWSVKNGDPVDKPAGQEWIGVPAAVEQYPKREKMLIRDDIDSADTLLAAAWEEAQKAAQPETLAEGTISDMEMAAGQTWKAIRKWDSVWVKPKNRSGVMLKVIKIERNYVYPDRTKMTMGEEEEETLAATVSRLNSASISAMRGVAGNSAALFKQQILVDELKTDISTVFINLDEVKTQITLSATKKELSEAENRISEAEVLIDGALAQIALKADVETMKGIESRVSGVELLLNGDEATAGLVTQVEEQGKKVSSAELRLDGAEAEIELKISKDGVVAAINATEEEVRISAGKIDLDGYVTTSMLDANITNVVNSFADTIITEVLQATSTAILASATIRGKGCKWTQETLVSGITKPILAGKTIWYVDHNGNNQSLWVATGWSTQMSYSTKSIDYMTSYGDGDDEE